MRLRLDELAAAFVVFPDRIESGWINWGHSRTVQVRRRQAFVRWLHRQCGFQFHEDDIQTAVDEFIAATPAGLASWYLTALDEGDFDLTFLDGAPRIKLYGLTAWRRLTSQIDPDALICLKLADREVKGFGDAAPALDALPQWGMFAGARDAQFERLVGNGLADNHVHLEACDPLPVAWLRLMRGDIKLQEINRYSPGERDRNKEDKIEAERRNEEIRWINKVLRGIDEKPFRHRTRLKKSLSPDAPNADFLRAERSFLIETWLGLLGRGALRYDLAQLENIRAFNRYLVGKNAFLRGNQQFPGHGPGLSTFRRYLDFGRSITEGRRVGKSRRIQAQRLRRLADYATECEHTHLVELRIAPRNRARDYVAFFQVWADPIMQDLAKSGRRPDVRFVLHFIRRPDLETRSKDTLHYSALWSILDRQSAVFHDFRTRMPELAKFIVGIDVANLERQCPPEIFAPYLARLRDNRDLFRQPDGHRKGRPKHKMCRYWNDLEAMKRADHSLELPMLRLTYHGGEDFYHPIDGIRQIAGLCDNLLSSGDRIGHGLALGWDLEEFERVRGDGFTIPSGVLLDDLVWLRREGMKRDLIGTSLRHRLDGAVDELCHGIYGIYAPQSDLEALLDERYHLPPEAKREKNGERIARRLYWLETHSGDVRRKRIVAANREQVDVLRGCLDLAVELQEELIVNLSEKGIVIEMCPTSNLSTGAVKDLSRHPLFRYHEVLRKRSKDAHGNEFLPVTTINTDDPGLFATRIDIEYALMLEAMDRRGMGRDAAFNLLEQIQDLGFRSAFPSVPVAGK